MVLLPRNLQPQSLVVLYRSPHVFRVLLASWTQLQHEQTVIQWGRAARVLTPVDILVDVLRIKPPDVGRAVLMVLNWKGIYSTSKINYVYSWARNLTFVVLFSSWKATIHMSEKWHGWKVICSSNMKKLIINYSQSRQWHGRLSGSSCAVKTNSNANFNLLCIERVIVNHPVRKRGEFSIQINFY